MSPLAASIAATKSDQRLASTCAALVHGQLLFQPGLRRHLLGLSDKAFDSTGASCFFDIFNFAGFWRRDDR